MRKRRRQRRRVPIPFAISFHLSFLDEGLSTQEWERQARRIVRDHLPTPTQDTHDKQEAGLWDEYDEDVGKLILEELGRN